MTKEEKELLLKDLSARLPYDTLVTLAEGGIDGLTWNNVTLNSYLLYQIEEEDAWKYIKPYLRPMSSMTEEEHNERFNYYHEIELKEVKLSGNYLKAATLGEVASIDWLNAHHFDYRGLIDKDLAIKVTEENNPYK